MFLITVKNERAARIEFINCFIANFHFNFLQ
jgi:hypothetical protein